MGEKTGAAANKITILMNFKGGGELALDTYSTLDIQRSKERLNINATNTAGDLAFNAMYDKMLEYLGKNDIFDIIIKVKGKKAATFGRIVADYHLNADREILTFGQKIEEKKEDE